MADAGGWYVLGVDAVAGTDAVAVVVRDTIGGVVTDAITRVVTIAGRWIVPGVDTMAGADAITGVVCVASSITMADAGARTGA